MGSPSRASHNFFLKIVRNFQKYMYICIRKSKTKTYDGEIKEFFAVFILIAMYGILVANHPMARHL